MCTTSQDNGKLPFAALEGIDGAGKSTIRDILAEAFAEQRIACTIIGQHSWLDPWTTRLIVENREQRRSHSPRSISDAYFRDKVLHGTANVLPASASSLVIADRYIVSDAVYLEALYGIPAGETLERHRAALTPMPSVLIYVSTPVEEAVRRIARRSKQVQHYERPTDLVEIVRIYRRVLLDSPPDWMPPTLVFDNAGGDLQRKVENTLLPRLRQHLPIKEVGGS